MMAVTGVLTYLTARDALVLHLREDADAHDREITDPRVLARFDVAAHPALGGRVQTLAARLRAV